MCQADISSPNSNKTKNRTSLQIPTPPIQSTIKCKCFTCISIKYIFFFNKRIFWIATFHIALTFTNHPNCHLHVAYITCYDLKYNFCVHSTNYFCILHIHRISNHSVFTTFPSFFLWRGVFIFVGTLRTHFALHAIFARCYQPCGKRICNTIECDHFSITIYFCVANGTPTNQANGDDDSLRCGGGMMVCIVRSIYFRIAKSTLPTQFNRNAHVNNLRTSESPSSIRTAVNKRYMKCWSMGRR